MRLDLPLILERIEDSTGLPKWVLIEGSNLGFHGPFDLTRKGSINI